MRSGCPCGCHHREVGNDVCFTITRIARIEVASSTATALRSCSSISKRWLGGQGRVKISAYNGNYAVLIGIRGNILENVFNWKFGFHGVKFRPSLRSVLLPPFSSSIKFWYVSTITVVGCDYKPYASHIIVFTNALFRLNAQRNSREGNYALYIPMSNIVKKVNALSTDMLTYCTYQVSGRVIVAT
jgi:hypothetical protein